MEDEQLADGAGLGADSTSANTQAAAQAAAKLRREKLVLYREMHHEYVRGLLRGSLHKDDGVDAAMKASEGSEEQMRILMGKIADAAKTAHEDNVKPPAKRL